MNLSGVTLRILLASTLLFSGLPAHAASVSPSDSQDDVTSEQEMPTGEASERLCPSHAANASDTSASPGESPAERSEDCSADGCCAGECGCNCMGMTLVIPLKRAALSMPTPATKPVASPSLPDPLMVTALLRPPQV